MFCISIPYGLGAVYLTYMLVKDALNMLRRILTCSACRLGKKHHGGNEYMQFVEYEVDHMPHDTKFEEYHKKLKEQNELEEA